jgi:hypothetical protein
MGTRVKNPNITYQHPQRRYESDDLKNSPECKEYGCDHCEGLGFRWRLVRIYMYYSTETTRMDITKIDLSNGRWLRVMIFDLGLATELGVVAYGGLISNEQEK